MQTMTVRGGQMQPEQRERGQSGKSENGEQATAALD